MQLIKIQIVLKPVRYASGKTLTNPGFPEALTLLVMILLYLKFEIGFVNLQICGPYYEHRFQIDQKMDGYEPRR